MKKTIKETIHANGIDIGVYSEDLRNDYISLTDIAKIQEEMLYLHPCFDYYSG